MDAQELLRLIGDSTRNIISGERTVAVAYSGGLDSSVLAAVARKSSDVRCYVCAVKGSFDARNAEERARSESLDLRVVELTGEALSSLAGQAVCALGTSNPVSVAYSIPVLAVLNEASEKLVLVGSGADELFGGYAKYVSAPNAEEMMRNDLLKMLDESRRLANAAVKMGKRMGFPFASDELIKFSKRLPIERKIGPSQRKVVLRDVAKLLELPSHDRPKKAAQYSSGVMREMERQAKLEGKSIAEWIVDLGVPGRRSS